MKTQAEVVARAKSLVSTELDRRLALARQRLPHRCIHNHRQAIDSRKTVEGEANPTYNTIAADGSPTIGLCMLGANNPEDWRGTICEDPIDAQRCPDFTPGQNLEQILTSFRSELADPEWVNVHMPSLAALMWVLDEQAPPRLGFFRRFLLSFTRIQLEPVQPKVDLTLLLPDK